MMKAVLSAILAASLLSSPHAEEDRPKIGLVLGGGGALGIAHIGVLQELERLRIPVDYIGGTSMGAIVAGMYASGMPPDEIERQFSSIDWWDVLKDRSSYQFLDYRRKLDARRFMGLELGIKDWRIVHLPGMAYGQKLNNLLETFVINSAGITDFNELNIPYRAVATDLASGKPITLKSGSLSAAMRASMAVPGIFTPFRMDGMVLVDGGIFDNIPVEAVKNMGPDIIIAVDVGATAAAKHASGEFHSLSEVILRTYTLVQRPGQEKQLAQADLVIAPYLPDTSPAQFHHTQEIIPAGRRAVQDLREKLGAYSTDVETYQAFLEKQRRKNTKEILVADIRVAGNKGVSEKVIRNHIKSRPGPLQPDTICDDLRRIHGMGNFQTVTYNLEPRREDFELQYNTTEKFWGPTYLHFGARLEAATDASTMWGLLLNYTQTQLNPLGGEIQVDLEVGQRKQMAFGEWYQPVSWGEHVFLALSLGYMNEDLDFYVGDSNIADIEQRSAYGALDAGISLFEYGEIRLGLVGAHVDVDGSSTPVPSTIDTVAGIATRVRLNQLDDPVFPTKGYRIDLDGLFTREEMGSSETFRKLEFQALAPLTFGSHTIIPRLALGSSLGSDLPFYAQFDAGGLDSFAGYAPHQLRGNYYGIGSLGYRYRLGRLPPGLGNGLYALARVDGGNAWFNSGDVRFDDLNYAALVGLGANTTAGYCTIAVGKAESSDVRFYFSIGNKF